MFERLSYILMRRSSPFWVVTLFLALLSTTGCMFRTRPVEEKYSTVPLKESSQQGLIDIINQQSETIHSLKATVDIDTSVGGVKKGHYTDYKEIRGYVLARQPGSLHMIGLMPIVRTTAFDMVSDGQEFKLWIPPKNRFVIGRNQVATPNTDQPLENIRPQDIYEALLIRRVDPATEIAVLENGYETLHDAKGHRIWWNIVGPEAIGRSVLARKQNSAHRGSSRIELFAENQVALLAEQADDVHERAPVFIVPQMEFHEELLDRQSLESPGREDFRQSRHLSPFDIDFQNIDMRMSQFGSDLAEVFDLTFLVFEDQIIGFFGVEGNRSQTHGMIPESPLADRLAGAAIGKSTLHGRCGVEAMDFAAEESRRLGVE